MSDQLERQVGALGREMGELTVAVRHIAEQMEHDREERMEYRRETRDRMNSHSRRLRITERVGGAVAAGLSAVLGIKIGWPF